MFIKHTRVSILRHCKAIVIKVMALKILIARNLNLSYINIDALRFNNSKD